MRRTILGAVSLVLLLQGAALADGFIIVPRHPPERPEVRTIPLAVKYHRVKVTIRDQVAVTEIDQVFVNPNPYQLEGTYIFPIPENASISAFSMFIDGKEMPGELLEKDKARGIYEDIVRSMRDPALLEYAGRDMFKASIFPIPARGEKRVKLSYQEICPADGGMVRYRYPLNTEKFSSRPLEDVSVVVDISGKLPIKNITCPSHRVEVVRKGDTAARVAYEEKNVTPDRDMVLYYALAEREFALNLLTFRPDPGRKGWFMLLLSPNTDDAKIQPKDVCFVMDTSGSMQGRKIEQAKAALRFCVQALNPGDRFNIVPFATEARTFADGLIDATPENVGKAVEFVDTIEALGGTAIDEALTKALGMSPDSARPYMVVFVTDGLPTIGETKEPVILQNVTSRNKGNVRLFAFGVGNDVNTHLLDKLAEQNRGSREYVAETEDLEFKVSTFFTKVSHPVLSDLELSFPGMEVTDLYPKKLPDLFRGSQLSLVGRYAGSGGAAVQLVGKIAGNSKKIAHDVTFPAEAKENDFLPRLWAIRKIGFLLDEIRLHGENEELKKEVVRLAKLYGVVTPYTSFLVLEDQARQSPPPPASRPGLGFGGGRAGAPGAEGKAGSGDGSSGGPAAPADDPATTDGAFRRLEEKDREDAEEGLGRATGGASVRASKEAKRLRGDAPGESSNGYVPDAGREKAKEVMRLVEDTAFYLRDGVWVQADLPKDLERKELELFGDEYFALLKKDPKVGRYLALGKVDFRVGEVVYTVR